MKTSKNRRLIVISLLALLFVGTLLLGARLIPTVTEDFYPESEHSYTKKQVSNKDKFILNQGGGVDPV